MICDVVKLECHKFTLHAHIFDVVRHDLERHNSTLHVQLHIIIYDHYQLSIIMSEISKCKSLADTLAHIIFSLRNGLEM